MRDGRMFAAPECTLAYHEILPEASSYLYNISVPQFEEHLNHIGNTNNAPELTFDDGHRSHFEYALPLLRASRRKATFFVLAGMLGNSADCISWPQAKLLVAEGHGVESHGWSHCMLTQCSSSELEREVLGSKQELESRLGEPVTALSAPGGRWNSKVVEMCARAGYGTLYHSNPWLPVQTLHGITLRGRFMVTNNMHGHDLAQLAHAGPVKRFTQQTRYAAKQAARSLLGDAVYHSIWCKLANFKTGDGMELQTAADRSSKLQ